MNSTDLHIKFKLATGYHPHWKKKYNAEPQRYQKNGGYTSAYAEWLEEKLLAIMNTEYMKDVSDEIL